MGMLHTQSFMPTTASAAGSGTAVSVSQQAHGVAADSLLALGITLLVLTIIFAVAAIRGLLPRRADGVLARRMQRGESP
jgi:ABC-type phosphate transport system permease subunit